MAKKSFLMIGGTIAFGIVAIGCLLLFSPRMPNQYGNGFKRIWQENPVQLIQHQDTDIPIQGICGATSEHIFINTNNPRCIIRQDYSLSRFDSIFFPVVLSTKVLSSRNFYIDSNYVHLFINNQPGFISAKLNDSMATAATFTQTKQLFSKATGISANSVVVRIFDSLQSKQLFRKIAASSGHVLAEEVLFEQQPDRGFGTDGSLVFDNAEKLIVYVQFYQNKFFIMDTNLVVLHQYNTIDTTFTNDLSIKKVRINGEDKLVPGKARITINKDAYAGEGLLYIISGLRADNESLKTFKNNTTIDIYRLDNGKYLGSLHIPNLNGNQKMFSFLVRKNKLVALFEKSIAVYQLRLFPRIEQL